MRFIGNNVNGGNFVVEDEDDMDEDLEIYGVSPGVIAFFMILISLIVPMGIIPFNAWIILGGFHDSNFLIYSLVWIFTPDFYLPFQFMPLFFLLNLWITLPLTIFNIAYIWKIIRYYRGQCTRYSVVWVGLISITIPTIFAMVTTGVLSGLSGFVFVGPIPIQFIAGLIFLYKIPGPEMTSPWRGDIGDNSWWTPKRPEWWDRMFPKEDTPEDLEMETHTER